MDKIVAATIDDLDYGELDIFEEIVGIIPTDEDTLDRLPKAKLLIALGYIAARREDPSVTLDEVKRLPLGSIVFSGADDPTEPATEK
jgi:hypothetical protein